MIDRTARDKAAALIRDYRDARIDNDRFVDAFPCKSEDRAIRAIRTRLWYFYDDLHRHKLEKKHALTPEGRALFDRCIAFLESDVEYAWPIDDFVGAWARPVLLLMGLCIAFGVAGYYAWPAILPESMSHWRQVKDIGFIVGAALGFCVWLPHLFVIRRRNRKIEAQYPADLDVWPFTSADQTARHVVKGPQT